MPGTGMDHYDLATRGERDGLWDWNLASNRVHFAPRWIAMVGCEEHEVGHSPDEWLDRVHPEDRPEVRREIDAHLEEGPGEFTISHRMLHKNGTFRWMACHAVVVRDESGQAVRLMGSHADVTADKVADAQTGLPNRLLFLDRLGRAIDRARRHPEFLFAALVLDLDRPEPARDQAGASAPDPLLTSAARRLETCLRSGDPPASLGRDYVVSRLRADEFGILLEGLAQVEEARRSAQRLLAEVLTPFSVNGHEVFVQPSIGIAVSTTGYARAEDVLRDADTALYRAKSLGKARCEVFDTALLDSARAELEMEADLEHGLDRHEFVLHYQPILSLASNRLAGFEALVRWQHPTRGLVPPLDFIPLAEKTGFIVRLGTWVVREACRQLAAWQAGLAAASDLWVSVNLSSTQFREPSLFEQISSAVRDAGIEPRCLMVELTESIVMENPVAAKGLIMQLRVMGVRVGLDDFGTGHSSLAYLHQFPADFLKVDRSFIRGLEARQDVAEIVRTVNVLADQLGLQVIAEGIESDEQLAVIRSLRCGYVQGFLLSRPVDPQRAEQFLKTSPQLTPETPAAAPGGVAAEAAPAGGKVSDEPCERLPGQRTSPPWRKWLWPGLAATAVIAAIAFGARVGLAPSAAPNPRPSSPAVDVARTAPPQAAQQAAPDRQAPVQPPPRPAAQVSSGQATPVPRTGQAAAAPSVKNPARTSPASTVPDVAPTRVPIGPAAPPAAEGPEAESFPVAHQHVIGSCSGHLVVSGAGVAFVPEQSKDGFTLRHRAFLVSLSDGDLTIKSDTKTYRFRAARATGPDDNRARLQRVVDAITRFAAAR